MNRPSLFRRISTAALAGAMTVSLTTALTTAGTGSAWAAPSDSTDTPTTSSSTSSAKSTAAPSAKPSTEPTVAPTVTPTAEPARPVTPDEILPNPPSAPRGPRNYVAIGDAFTVAGERFAQTETDCLRNASDYPHQLAASIGLDLKEAACVDADTTNYVFTRRAGATGQQNRAQASSINRNTRLITIQLGLEDVIGSKALNLYKQCMALWTSQYLQLASGQPTMVTGSPCRDTLGRVTVAKLFGLRTKLAYIYKDAQRRAPNALVIAVGYYQIFNDWNFCWDAPLIPRQDRIFLNGLYTKVNSAVRLAAKDAKVPALLPDRNQSALTTACGAPFLRYATASTFPEFSSLRYAPTPAGQKLIAERLGKMWSMRKSR